MEGGHHKGGGLLREKGGEALVHVVPVSRLIQLGSTWKMRSNLIL
jgi:hypothetical protein